MPRTKLMDPSSKDQSITEFESTASMPTQQRPIRLPGWPMLAATFLAGVASELAVTAEQWGLG